MNESKATHHSHIQESKNTDGHHLDWNTLPKNRFLYLQRMLTHPGEKKEQEKAEQDKMTISNQHINVKSVTVQPHLTEHRKSWLAAIVILN